MNQSSELGTPNSNQPSAFSLQPSIEPLSFADAIESDIGYWPIERVREIQDRHLRSTIALCAVGHPYLRRILGARGLSVGDIRGTDDLVKLPVTTKHEFNAEPESFRLNVPDWLPLEERTLRELIYTTGTTTGKPTPIYTTTSDYYGYLVNQIRSNRLTGLGETDVIANLWPLTAGPGGAYIRSEATASAAGCTVLTINTGRPDPRYPFHRSLDEAVRLIERHRATILYGVASFVRRVIVRAGELGADLSPVRMCIISGEASSRAMRLEMIARLQALGAIAPQVNNRYGATESGSFYECVDGGGWHNVTPEHVFVEIVDPASGDRLPIGEPGLVTISHLTRRGTVLLRYAIGDLAALTADPCPACRRTGPRLIGQPTRTKDIVKIKGTLVNLTALTEAIAATDGVGEFQFVIRKVDLADPFSLDDLLLRIAVSTGQEAAVRETCYQHVLTIAQMRATIEIVSPEAIFDPARQAKVERLVDLRPAIE